MCYPYMHRLTHNKTIHGNNFDELIKHKFHRNFVSKTVCSAYYTCHQYEIEISVFLKIQSLLYNFLLFILSSVRLYGCIFYITP